MPAANAEAITGAAMIDGDPSTEIADDADLEHVIRELLEVEAARGRSFRVGRQSPVGEPRVTLTIVEPPDACGLRSAWAVSLPAVVRGQRVVDLTDLLRAEVAAPLQRHEVEAPVEVPYPFAPESGPELPTTWRTTGPDVVVYGTDELIRAPPRSPSGARLVVRVVEQDALAAAHELQARGRRPAVLVFASARNPGGGYKVGAHGQEESLCRASALAAALESPAATPFYEAGRGAGALNTSAIVYTPGIEVYRTQYEPVWSCAFITCAAPNAREAPLAGHTGEQVRAALIERARRIVDVAIAHGHDALVLGAWGCGAFSCEPEDVAGAFDVAVDGAGGDSGLREVVFAIDAPGTERWVIRVFEARFGGSHEGAR